MPLTLRIRPYASSAVSSKQETRTRSAAVFGNEKWVEVALALEAIGGTPLSQHLARHVGINSDLVTAVLQRMQDAQLVKAMPRIGSPTRGSVPWEVQPGPRWDALVRLCHLLVDE